VLLVDRKAVSAYVKTQTGQSARIVVDAMDRPTGRMLSPDLLLVYFYRCDQLAADAEASGSDDFEDIVVFKHGSGTRLMRAIDKNRDVYFVHKVEFDAKSGAVVMPSTGAIIDGLKACSQILGVRVSIERWIF
jgi:hypothetical protein